VLLVCLVLLRSHLTEAIGLAPDGSGFASVVSSSAMVRSILHLEPRETLLSGLSLQIDRADAPTTGFNVQAGGGAGTLIPF